MGNDIININGKNYTIGRARALGLIPRPTTPVPAKVSAIPAATPAAPVKRGRPPGSKNKKVVDIDFRDFLPEDGDKSAVSPPGKIKPLVPTNVDHAGIPITDEETLARIIARTAEIEAAAKAAE